MNLQHERILALCGELKLPFAARDYAAAAQEAARGGHAHCNFLEGLLRAERAGRLARKQSLLTRLAGFPAVKTLEDFDFGFATGVKRAGRAVEADPTVCKRRH